MKINPLLFSWRNSWTNFRYYGIAILIFLLGLLLSLLAFKFYVKQDLNRTHAEFDRIADSRLFLLRDILLATLEEIELIKQFYHASTQITQKEFHIFVQAPFKFYPNLLALGWIEANPQQDSSNKPTLSLEFIDTSQPYSSALSHYIPFKYLELGDPATPLYINLSDYTTFVNLLKKSSQNPSTISVSSTVDFFQDGKKQGFFLFKPIFFEHMVAPEGKTGLFGTIVGLSSFTKILENVRSHIEPLGINIGIYDITADSHLIYWSEASILQDPPDLSPKDRQLQEQWARTYIFQFGDREWELKAIPTLGFIHQRRDQHWSYWEVPVIGILISGLITSYFLNLANRRKLIEQEVKERINELATINSILQQEIHERQRIEEDFARTQRNLQRRHEALEYLTKLTISELRTAIHEVILRTATVMQIDRVSVWFYDTFNNIERLSCHGLYILSTNSFSNHLEFTSTYFPHYFKALSKQSHLILPSVQDAELNQELSSYFAVFHVISKLDIPIVFEGKLLGVLSCEETTGHREWLLEDRHFGQNIADIIAIMIEQSARRKAEKALQESEERLRFITQKAVDAIISLNDKEEIISWNLGAEKMFGFDEMEMLGKSIQVVIPQNGFFSFLKEIKTKPIEIKGQHKDGHLFPVEVSHSRWQSGELYFDTIIMRDITERKEYERRLIKAMREAKASNEAKNEFLATISHELRTPLNAIIGFDQCLLLGMDGPVNEAQFSSLKKIEKSSFHLLSIIGDILDFAKFEAKKMELEVMPYNIVDIVISSVDEMKSIAQRKNLEISLSYDKPFILVEVDKGRVRQVLLNLLSNAIKFTEEGSISVTVLNYPNQVTIQVTDTGIGLSQEEIDKIFHPFTQADSSITRKYGGTGLGLVISKKIIDLHGGILSVESQKGKGSTFTVTLQKIQ
jgi:PAS domain S-box-containing protein